MDLFNLAAKLTLDSSEFEKGATNADKRGKSLASSLGETFTKIKKFAIGAISVAAVKKGIDSLVAFATEVSNVGDKIDKQSQALGLSRKAYQEWDYILGQNGASIDSLGTSMKTLNSAILSAADGSKESMTAFRKLGLNVHQIENMNMEDQFEAVVRAFQKLPAGAKKSALAVQLFGRNGMELLPLLNQSEASLDELRARAEELGIIMSDDAVDASVAYNDALDDLNRTFNGLKYSIGSKLLPAMTNAFGKITSYAGKISRAYQEKGFSGVFETLLADFKNIKWPSWDDVGNAITVGWESIKNGVSNLGGIVFGTKEDGSVAWPDWDDVSKAATDAWNKIKESALTLAGLVLGKKEDGTVNWPDWDAVKEAASNAWEAIKTKALSIADGFGVLIFGRKTDGSVNWPDWDTVKAKAGEVWGTIKSGALSIADSFGDLVFGKKEDGTVAWPEWSTVWDALSAFWEKIKTSALNVADTLGGLVFGRAEDGSVTWPDISGIIESFNVWWDETARPAIQNAATWVLSAFGVPVESAEELGAIVAGWWDGIVGYITDLLSWSLNLPDEPYDAGTQLHDIVVGWWESVVGTLQELLKWFIGIPQMTDKEGNTTGALIKAWWDQNVVPKLTDVLNFVLGLFGLPDASEMKDKIVEWWEDVKKQVGELILNIIPNILGIPTGSPASGDGSVIHQSEGGMTHGGGGHGFAKGLNYVPYDNFIAQLHRGEEVLTASQARKRRDGNDGNVDISALVAQISGAVRDGMQGASVNSYLSGRDVTDDVSRNTIRQLKARRFAT